MLCDVVYCVGGDLLVILYRYVLVYLLVCLECVHFCYASLADTLTL